MTEAQVRATGLPPHVFQTDSFKPLPHGVVLDSIETALNKAGLEIARDDSGTHRKRFTVVDFVDKEKTLPAKMFATLPLTARIDDSSRLMVGIVNSWNKTLALRVGFGSEVFVCTNGAFFAERIVGRKHTPNILVDLPGLMAAALEHTKTYVEQQTKFFARLRDVNLTNEQAHDFIVRSALDHDCITGGEIADVVTEWRNPRFDEFKPRTAWSLHNAFTECLKRIQGMNGVIHAERSVRLSGMFVSHFATDLNLSPALN